MMLVPWTHCTLLKWYTCSNLKQAIIPGLVRLGQKPQVLITVHENRPKNTLTVGFCRPVLDSKHNWRTLGLEKLCGLLHSFIYDILAQAPCVTRNVRLPEHSTSRSEERYSPTSQFRAENQIQLWLVARPTVRGAPFGAHSAAFSINGRILILPLMDQR